MFITRSFLVFRECRYTAHYMPHLLHTVVRGNTNGQTVVFIHGWPDTDEVFEKMYTHLGSTYRLVAIQLPYFHKADQSAELSPFLPKPGYCGYTLEEVTQMVIDTIQDTTVTVRGQPPLLVAHDWGAILSYMALKKVPTLVRKMVALDIGQHSKPSLKGIAILVAYQWTLIVAFFLPRILGNALTRLVARVFKAPGAAVVQSSMNFFYVQTWMLLLTGRAQSLQKWAPPTIPILYLYGKDKPLFFHSPRWLDYVEKQAGSKVVAYPGDHWFFTRRKCAEQVNDDVAAFLAAP
jgi:cis-3-alkyl-4-acyloxetan-2-one decarboxylase